MTTRAAMIEAVNRALDAHKAGAFEGDMWAPDLTEALTAAADALAAEDWRPVGEAKPRLQYICGHAEKKWVRFGRFFPEMGNRWYYSGTSERSQYAETTDDKPTHVRPMPAPPAREG